MPVVNTHQQRDWSQETSVYTDNYDYWGVPFPTNPTGFAYSVAHPVLKKDRSWFRDPNYLTLQRSHAVLPENNYSTYQYDSDETPEHFTVTVTKPIIIGSQNGFVQTRKRSNAEANDFYHSEDTRDIVTMGELKAKLLEKQRGQQWNAPVFMAEAGKTVNMVVDRARHLVMLARALRRGDANAFLDGLRAAVEGGARRRAVQKFNRSYGRGPSQAAANMWLEYKYGWTPFMNDVHDATMTLMDIAETEPEKLVGRTRATVRRRLPRTETYGPDSWDFYSKMTLTGSYLDHSRRGVWHWEPKPESIPARLGLTNPALVAWELVPFSFVADWFLPISDYLSQIDTPFRVNHVGGSYGERRITLNVLGHEAKAVSPYDVAAIRHSTWNRSIRIDRTPMAGIPYLELEDFSLNPKLGASRITSALALLRQNLSRFRRG